MKSFSGILLAAPVAFAIVAIGSAAGQRAGAPAEQYGPPEPYQYSYATEDKEGSSTAEESSDGSGRIQGKYTLSLADGRTRTVTYWADDSGFHADVVTNELGTESKNPADVTIQSSAPTGEQAALQFGSVKAKASYAAPVFVPAPVARGLAAVAPLQERFFKSS